ncbi:hypothetical protein P1P68_02190 [Streptomyces scabiei]|uniref:hypothetical protein n=1 Tax=Streptomyces scabiei TaxID=1930 RepID=UPI00298FAA8A|nr:hypothetical protein [Streptomyces scabiei]MDW8803644.1 hypothetical protein [Streptomyces scabiei]
MDSPRHLGTDSAGTPLVAGPRPDDDEMAPLPEGADPGAARAARAHEVQEGDLILGDFPAAEPGAPREADYFTAAYVARPAGTCGECRNCYTDRHAIGDTPDYQVRYVVLASDPDDGCDIWFRNEPLLIIPAANLTR